jgi:cobalt/nickel transport system permease protein
MRIPDGYLSPVTCAVTAAAAVPFLVVASRKVTEVVKTKDVPLLAMFSAVSFLVMMFNVPIPDGTTAHAVGAVIIAIVLGPWAAVIAVTVALLFQALLFGDGGVLTLGANVLNMAVIMPFVGLWAYRAVAGRSPLTSRRRLVAAGIAGYIGINAAALATAIELGIQPLVAHTADGTPLYSPYGLAQTIPAMALAHLTIAGAAEAILTVGVFAYLAHADVRRLVPNHPGIPLTAADAPVRQPVRVSTGRVAIGFVVAMVALAPLGLLAPGGAFGEDASEDLNLSSLGLSSIPDGLNRFSGFWSHTLLGDYGFADGQNAVLGYWLSALVGIAVIGAVIYLLARLAAAIGHRSGRPGAGSDPTGADVPAAL